MANPTIKVEIKTLGAAKAKKDLAGVEKAAKRTGKSFEDFGKRMATQFKKTEVLTRMKKDLDRLRMAIKKVGGDTQPLASLTNKMNALSKSFEKGRLTNKQLAEQMQKWRASTSQAFTTVNRATAAVTKAVPPVEKLTKATDKLTKATKKGAKEGKGFTDKLRNIGSSAVFAVGPLSGIGARVTAFTAIMNRGTVITAVWLLAFSAFTILLLKGVKAATAAETSMLKFEAVLIATGNKIGLTAAALDDMALAFAKSTLASVEGGRAATALLVSFGATRDTLKELLVLSQGMASVMGQSLSTAARQLGRAMEDPLANMDSLRRFGIQLDPIQKRQILRFTSLGEKAKGFGIILDDLKGSIGDLATREIRGLAGALDTLSQSWTVLLETIGQQGGLTVGKFFAESISGFLDLVTLAITGTTKASKQLMKELSSSELKRFIKIQEQFVKSTEFAGLGVTKRRGIRFTLLRAKQRLPGLEGQDVKADKERIRGLGNAPFAESLRLIDKATVTRLQQVSSSMQDFTGESRRVEPELIALADRFAILGDKVAVMDSGLTFLQLDLAKANEALKKVRLQAEGFEVFKRTRRPVELFTFEMRRLKKLMDAKVITVETYNRAVGDTREQLIAADPILSKISGAFDGLGKSIVTAFESGERAGSVFKSFLRTLTTSLLETVIQMLIIEKIKRAILETGGATSASGFSAFLKLFGIAARGAAGPPGGGGGGSDNIGLQHGGSFRVPGGAGGADSRLLKLAVTPGEHVSVTRPEQTGRRRGGGDTYIVDMRGAAPEAVLQLQRFVASLDATLEQRAVSATQSARARNPGLFGGT